MASQEPQSAKKIRIQLNGEPHELEAVTGLTALLERIHLKRGRVAVELNGAIISRADYDLVVIKDGDIVEVVNFVGGG